MEIKRKFSSREQVEVYVNSLPIQMLIDGMVDLLWEAQGERQEKIAITEAQFKQFFKIKGFTDEGKVETRGRKPKVTE